MWRTGTICALVTLTKLTYILGLSWNMCFDYQTH